MMEPEEYLYLSALSQWVHDAPLDSVQNTQIARMVKVLRLLGIDDQKMIKLERNTKRGDGRSPISKDRSWMNLPNALGHGWYFEGNMSLVEKKKILHDLPKLGLASREFASCAEDFVSGDSVKKYWPSHEDAVRLIKQWKLPDDPDVRMEVRVRTPSGNEVWIEANEYFEQIRRQ
ncbi:hypothetical protein [Bradyrhizobium yuanmingense]|uniref:Uncharacterized protein n=1 Tax=Bradyrhizobium yuanmingense TaxID=108015 RepID=A0A1C3XGZ0_9BRAD|nr:hypothetical protein [Bradyrhizobium yuanmingense]MCA1530883.1 hypothetical protein [Bradyrhizobium yuanmingense]TWI18467.1 hypothetical protein IQ15_07145 [Bradyrhizobium yuanmingense]SCB51508.1 hypothetical protein GA0061099_10193 [Bradyrhizobium yuanmingense]